MTKKNLDEFFEILENNNDDEILNYLINHTNNSELSEKIRENEENAFDFVDDLIQDFISQIPDFILQIPDELLDYFEQKCIDNAHVYIGNMNVQELLLIPELIQRRDDSKKIELIDKEDSIFFKADIISVLQDDSKKIEYLNNLDGLHHPMTTAQILSSIQDDSKGIEYLNSLDEYEDELDDKISIISDLESGSKIMEYLNNVNGLSIDDKVNIICHVRYDSIKIEYLKNTPN